VITAASQQTVRSQVRQRPKCCRSCPAAHQPKCSQPQSPCCHHCRTSDELLATNLVLGGTDSMRQCRPLRNKLDDLGHQPPQRFSRLRPSFRHGSAVELQRGIVGICKLRPRVAYCQHRERAVVGVSSPRQSVLSLSVDSVHNRTQGDLSDLVVRHLVAQVGRPGLHSANDDDLATVVCVIRHSTSGSASPCPRSGPGPVTASKFSAGSNFTSPGCP
jgi:hypothetical protein